VESVCTMPREEVSSPTSCNLSPAADPDPTGGTIPSAQVVEGLAEASEASDQASAEPRARLYCPVADGVAGLPPRTKGRNN